MKLEVLLHKHGSSASNSGYQNVASFVCGGIEMLTGGAARKVSIASSLRPSCCLTHNSQCTVPAGRANRNSNSGSPSLIFIHSLYCRAWVASPSLLFQHSRETCTGVARETTGGQSVSVEGSDTPLKNLSSVYPNPTTGLFIVSSVGKFDYIIFDQQAIRSAGCNLLSTRAHCRSYPIFPTITIPIAK
jgi:hypothetical protein